MKTEPKIVVVVDDELLVRQDALDLLTRAGLDVRGFSSAAATLDFLREHAEDTAAVFTDVWMESETEGIELARAIGREWPWIALLVTSGGTSRPPDGLPMKAQFVPKPWRPDQVLRLIQKSLSKPIAFWAGRDYLAGGVQTTESLRT